ncbi:MAG: hypothetical protein AMXMBFR84_39660 [Candidatus Hydrogenedentota bacterium]
MGLITCALLGAGVLTVLKRQFKDAPESLDDRTLALTDAVDRFLEEQFIPRSAITRKESTAQADSGMRWRHTQFDVALPASVTVPGITSLLRVAMAEHGVTISDDPLPDGHGWKLHFFVKNREFIDMAIRGYFVDSLAPADYTQETAALAEQLIGVLAHDMPAGSQFNDVQTEIAADQSSRWTLTRFTLALAGGASQQYILDSANRFAGENQMDISLETSTETGGILRAFHRGLQIVEADFTSPTPEPANGVETNEPISPAMDAAEMPDVPLNSQDLAETGETVEPDLTGERVSDQLRLALIVDDGGYGGNTTERLLQLDPNLTLAIIPGTPYGTETATRGAELGFEIMIHMPMESHGEGINGANRTLPEFITIDMPAEDIANAVKRAIEDIPHAVGLNNHTGSKYTMYADPMKVVLETLKENNLYFIDSITTGKSVAYQTAQEVGVKSAKRDLFLDNEANTEYIRARFKELIGIVKRKGEAIAICHFRPRTIDVLESILPELKDQGIELVHASEMIH